MKMRGALFSIVSSLICSPASLSTALLGEKPHLCSF